MKHRTLLLLLAFLVVLITASRITDYGGRFVVPETTESLVSEKFPNTLSQSESEEHWKGTGEEFPEHEISEAQRRTAFNQLTRLMAQEAGFSPEAFFPEEEYRFSDNEAGKGISGNNPMQNISIRVGSGADCKIVVCPEGVEEGDIPAWTFSMRAVGLPKSGTPTIHGNGARIERSRGSGVTEWYLNDHRGLEQGFTVNRPLPHPKIDLELVTIGLESEVINRGGTTDHIVFRSGTEEEALYYHGIHVYDAEGKSLPARLEASQEGAPDTLAVALTYNPENAVYPITVDPFVSTQLGEFTGTNPSRPRSVITFSDFFLFEAFVDGYGDEWWKSDGTAVGTTLLKDIRPGDNDSAISVKIKVGDTLYFTAWQNTEEGAALWKTDGTPEGTVLVRDARPGFAQQSSAYSDFTASDGIVFFVVDDGTHGEELWKTDGTETGTTLVKDITPGVDDTYLAELTDAGGLLFFLSDGGATGRELWKTDGTEMGTVIVKDINPDAAWSSPSYLTEFDGELYFRANDGTNGIELWKSDGTEMGTVLVKNISPDSGSSSPYPWGAFGGALLFTAVDPANGRELWKTDGTEVGTVLVKDISTDAGSAFGSFDDPLLIDGATVFFEAFVSGVGSELWKSDGTEMGTEMVKEIYSGAFSPDINSFTPHNGVYFFIANDGINGAELWKTDGTEMGTEIVKDIRSGAEPAFGLFGTNLVSAGPALFFAADDGIQGEELWQTDGTDMGTVMVRDLHPGTEGSDINFLFEFGGKVFFDATDGLYGAELWQSDGTEMGTGILIDLQSSSSDVQYESEDPWRNNTVEIAEVNGTLFFSAGDPVNGVELWKSDGTAMGTELVEDILPGIASSFPERFTSFGTELFFTANDGTSGVELWKSDGTAAGTEIVKDINPGSENSNPADLTMFNGDLVFQADDGSDGREPWKTDGTELGTEQLADLASGSDDSFASGFTEFNGLLYFSATVDPEGWAIWRTDGTTGGTSLFLDVNPMSTFGSPGRYFPIGSIMYFSASDGVNGEELWKTDGTVGGTEMVKDIRSGSSSSFPRDFAGLNGALIFSAATNDQGVEPWRSNGTAGGTVLLRDINPGSSSSLFLTRFTDDFETSGNFVFFAANDGEHGLELWRTDGTSGGTILLSEIIPGGGFNDIEAITCTASA